MSNTYDQDIREMAGMLGQQDIPPEAVRQVREGMIMDHLDQLCDTACVPKQQEAGNGTAGQGQGQKAG